MVVTNSGSDVPKAITESEIKRSEIPIALAMVLAESTTSSLPPTTPINPRTTKRNDLPILYFGFSISLLLDLPRRFFLAIAMR